MTTASTTRAATVEFDHVTKVYGADAAKGGTPGAVNDLSLTSPPARSACSSGRRAAARPRRSRWSTG